MTQSTCSSEVSNRCCECGFLLVSVHRDSVASFTSGLVAWFVTGGSVSLNGGCEALSGQIPN